MPFEAPSEEELEGALDEAIDELLATLESVGIYGEVGARTDTGLLQ